jgi:hypothetical protein
LESVLNNSPNIKSAMIIQIGIAWINSGEDHRGEEQEKLHLE